MISWNERGLLAMTRTPMPAACQTGNGTRKPTRARRLAPANRRHLVPPGRARGRVGRQPEGRAAALEAALSPAGRQAVDTALRQIDRLTAELGPLRRQLDMYSRRQPGCAALRTAHFGIGAVTSVAIWAGLGDVRRFTSSDDVVRHTGLDITVHSSDTTRPPGKLSRQGPPLPRWALYEAVKSASRPAAPDHGYYAATRDRRDGGLATLPVARKLARRCYHTLRELGEQALSPAA